MAFVFLSQTRILGIYRGEFNRQNDSQGETERFMDMWSSLPFCLGEALPKKNDFFY